MVPGGAEESCCERLLMTAVNGEASESTECMGMKLMAPEDGRGRRFVRSKEWQKAVEVSGSSFPGSGTLGLLSGIGGAVTVSFLNVYTCKPHRW